jgi:hypothetical protein
LIGRGRHSEFDDRLRGALAIAWTSVRANSPYLSQLERIDKQAVVLETARYMLVDPPGREQRFYSDSIRARNMAIGRY